MRTFSSFTPLMLGGITRLLPSSTHEEERFRALGVPAAKITTTGNIKLDVAIPTLNSAEMATLRKELGIRSGLVLLGASTWPGEEEALVNALRAVQDVGVPCSLILVPRHAERRMDIERMLSRGALAFHFRSRGAASEPVDVAVADTTGELRKLLQLADLIFVGKSLPPHTEGQTPVEGAALGKPILFGPGMSNFTRIAEELLARGGARQVADAKALAEAAAKLLHDPAQREALAKGAVAWHRDNAGAVDRTWRVLRAELNAR